MRKAVSKINHLHNFCRLRRNTQPNITCGETGERLHTLFSDQKVTKSIKIHQLAQLLNICNIYQIISNVSCSIHRGQSAPPDCTGSRQSLGLALILLPMKHLSVQVAELHLIVVQQAQAP